MMVNECDLFVCSDLHKFPSHNENYSLHSRTKAFNYRTIANWRFTFSPFIGECFERFQCLSNFSLRWFDARTGKVTVKSHRSDNNSPGSESSFSSNRAGRAGPAWNHRNSSQTRHFSLVINISREKYRAIKSEPAKFHEYKFKQRAIAEEKKSSHGPLELESSEPVSGLLASIKFLFKEIKIIFVFFREFMIRQMVNAINLLIHSLPHHTALAGPSTRSESFTARWLIRAKRWVIY